MATGLRWSSEQIKILTLEYPTIGLKNCAAKLGMRCSQVRSKASKMGIRQDRNSEFFKDWQARAAASKIGKKRPAQALLINQLKADGRLVLSDAGKARISVAAKKRIAKDGHPRGALGMKHTEETRRKIGEKSKAAWQRMPQDVRDQYSIRGRISGAKATMNRANASWKAGWREVGGQRVYFRSRWEANYARYLQWLKERGEIYEWEHEPHTFWFEGIKRGCVSYLPDFRVTENSSERVYHEVKGWMDDRSKTKIKRMAKYYPGVKLIVINSRQYKALQKTMRSLVREWEE
jgi:hypothetical protein